LPDDGRRRTRGPPPNGTARRKEHQRHDQQPYAPGHIRQLSRGKFRRRLWLRTACVVTTNRFRFRGPAWIQILAGRRPIPTRQRCARSRGSRGLSGPIQDVTLDGVGEVTSSGGESKTTQGRPTIDLHSCHSVLTILASSYASGDPESPENWNLNEIQDDGEGNCRG
jgi:hypothetical protein